METGVHRYIIKTAAYVSTVFAVMILLWFTSRYNYLLFHSLAELMSIGVAAAMFSVAWDSRRFSTNGYLTFAGIAFAFVACLDMVHMLAYKGMGVFPAYGANLPTQLWIAARGMEAVSLLISPVFLFRRVRPWPTLLSCLAVTAALLVLIFPLDMFPVCYVESGPHKGLAPFKIGTEYVICAVLLTSMGLLWAARRRFSSHVLILIICAIGATILSELAFTRYASVYGDFNMAGHLLKVAAFLLFYKALVQTSLKDPYQGLFRDLKQQEEALRESEERYRTTVESIGDAVIAVDPKGVVTFINRVAETLTGWERGEATGQGISQVFAIINEKTRRPADNPVERVLLVGHIVGLANHTTLISRDGREIPIEDSAAPIRSVDGKILGVVMVFHDVTEKRLAENALRASEERYRALFENASDAILITDPEKGRVLSVNPAACHMLGYTEEECLALTAEDLAALGGPDIERILEERERTGRASGSLTYKRKDGTILEGEISSSFFTDGKGTRQAASIIRDVTEHRLAQEALRESEKQYRLLFAANPNPMFVFDEETSRFLAVNDAAVRHYGWSREEFLAMTVLDIRPPEDRAPAQEIIEQHRGAKEARIGVFRHCRKDGRVMDMEITASSIGFAGRAARLCSMNDITERTQIEKAQLFLLHCGTSGEPFFPSLARYLATELGMDYVCIDRLEGDRLSATTTAIYSDNGVVDNLTYTLKDTPCGEVIGKTMCCFPSGVRHLFPTDVVLQEMGAEGYLGVTLWGSEGQPIGLIAMISRMPFEDTRAAESILGLVSVRAAGELERMGAEETLRKAHDDLEQRIEERTLQLSDAYRSLQREMEERKHAEEQLRQSQKMEAMGTLAGGIAHDFNNTLAAIIGFTEMAIEDISDRPDVKKYLGNVLKSSMRARDLVKQILTFSRKANHERAPLPLTPIIEETVQFLRASIPATIEIRLSVSAVSDTILASPVEVQQILMNLATNASLAMQENGGVIEISLADSSLGPDSPMPGADTEPGEYLSLTVKDTGTGMSPEVMKRIFEPFFTTRDIGKGTGMGLAMVYGIVQDLQGAITVESQPGQGSTFRVLLPKVKADAKPETSPAPEIPGGNERILFLDDEEMLVEWGQTILQRLGYEVTAATESEEALKAFSEDPMGFDLVITDHAMPGMAGSQLAEKLLAIRKDLPIILCTGHSETVSPERAREIGIRKFLMKPLAKQELAVAVRQALEGEGDE